jgi:hypothetical protein
MYTLKLSGRYTSGNSTRFTDTTLTLPWRSLQGSHTLQPVLSTLGILEALVRVGVVTTLDTEHTSPQTMTMAI